MLLAYDTPEIHDDRLCAAFSANHEVRRFIAGADSVPECARGVVVFNHGATLDALMSLHADCAARHVPWLTIADRGRHLQVGPLFAPWLAPLCPKCASQRLLNAPPDGATLDRAILQRRIASQVLMATAPAYPWPLVHLIALTAVEQLRDPVAHAGHTLMLDTIGYAVTRARFSGLPGCSRCRPVRADAGPGSRFTERLDTLLTTGGAA